MSEESSRNSVFVGAITQAALHPRPVWTSERAYILSAVAGVVGLGAIWRYSYVAGEGGGGSFVVAYIITTLLVGVPLAVLESTAGNMTQRSPVGMFRGVHRRLGPFLGWLVIGITAAIMSYYFVITGWTLGYAIDGIGGNLLAFDDFTSGMASLWHFLAVAVLVWLVMMRGVGMVERISRYLLPFLVLIIGGLTVYAQTLPGAGEAAGFYLGFDWARFVDPHTWQLAAGQTFYSLGVGQGLLITYGSYGPAGVNLIRSTSAIAATNACISIVAGLMIFPMVFSFGVAPDAGSEMAFTAFPRVFNQIAGGRVLGAAFFCLLFVAGFTSCIGGVVVVVATVRDELGLGRVRATGWVIATIVALGIPSALSFTSVGLEVAGMPFLDLMDRVTGSGIMLVAGLGGAGAIAWLVPMRRLLLAMNADPIRLGPLRPSPSWLVHMVRWIPAVALVAWLLAHMF